MITPYISREDVSNALASLIHSPRKLETNGLRHLLLVDLLVSAPEMPDGNGIREYAVRELLVTQITEALSEQRALFLLDAPADARDTVNTARLNLAQDARMNAPELIVWSVLYHRYVRADLGFTPEMLAQITAVHVRTIARHNDEGIDRLTRRLIDGEKSARKLYLQRWLNTLLPNSVPSRMVGREEDFHSVNAVLNAVLPRHLLVTGTTGVGKTTFVQEVIRNQINWEKLDQIVWIDEPQTIEYVRQQIAVVARYEGSSISLRDYLQVHRTAIVLDGIENVVKDTTKFALLLRDLDPALVFLINHVYVFLDGIGSHIRLQPIDARAAEMLVSNLLPGNDTDYKQNVALDLYERVGGNPLALKLAAGFWENNEDWMTGQDELSTSLFMHLFLSFDDVLKRAWCLLTLLPFATSLNMLKVRWHVEPQSIAILVHDGLLEKGKDDYYLLVSSARQFIQQQYELQSAIRWQVDDLINEIKDDTNVFEILERILITDFPQINLEWRMNWVSMLWQEGLRRNHWAQWRIILEEHFSHVEDPVPDLRIGYGSCLRHLSKWEAAEEVFEQVVAECGKTGQFTTQARALLEWSALVKQRGDYQRAKQYILQAKRFAQRARDVELLLALSLIEAEILIQQGNAANAYEILKTLPQSASVLSLESEAQLALGAYERCQEFALRALNLVREDQASEASLYTIIGRSFKEQGDQHQAQRYLTNAVTLLERLGDTFALARAQTNLAAALISVRRFTDAGFLLTQAEQEQVRLGDQIGLTATRHNRSILGRYIAR